MPGWLGGSIFLIPDVGLSAPDADPEEYREFFQAVPSGLFILDAEQRIRHTNPAAALLFPPGVGGLYGQPFSEIFAATSRSEVEKAFVTMGSDMAAAFRRLTVEVATVDGARFPVEVTILRLGSRNAPTFGAVVRDLRERSASKVASEPVADPRESPTYSLGELLMANRLRELV